VSQSVHARRLRWELAIGHHVGHHGLRGAEKVPITGIADDHGLRLDCGRCVFRPWREGDEPSLARHADNYEVWRRLRDRFPHPYTHADTEQWIASARQQDPQTSFATEARGEAVGGIGLELGSDIERRSAEIGY
jgi:RimJ/RimL family protein N-acetyltransferase